MRYDKKDPFSTPLRNLRPADSPAGSALAQLLSRRAAAFAGFAGLKARKLIVAASPTVARYWLPSRLRAFQAANPGIEVNVRIANTERAAMDVREGAADLGFVEGEVDDGALSVFRVDGELAKRPFYAVRHKERHVSNAEAALLASIGTAT
jgi:hypothetical protein